jgi:hypothetical protein
MEGAMLRHIASAYRRLVNHRNIRAQRNTRLEVLLLEERATPAVDFLAPVAAPTVVVVAPLSSAAADVDMTPLYRLDLLPMGSSAKPESAPEFEETAEAKSETASHAESEATAEMKSNEEIEQALIEAMEEELMRMMSES